MAPRRTQQRSPGLGAERAAQGTRSMHKGVSIQAKEPWHAGHGGAALGTSRDTCHVVSLTVFTERSTGGAGQLRLGPKAGRDRVGGSGKVHRRPREAGALPGAASLLGGQGSTGADRLGGRGEDSRCLLPSSRSPRLPLQPPGAFPAGAQPLEPTPGAGEGGARHALHR